MFDLSTQPEIVQRAAGYALQGIDIAREWLLSPAAWSQFGLLALAFALSLLLTRRLRPVLQRLLTPDADSRSPLAMVRRFWPGSSPASVNR